MTEATNGGSKPQPTPNDDRSRVKNPNNPDFEADQANRDKQKGGQAPK